MTSAVRVDPAASMIDADDAVDAVELMEDTADASAMLYQLFASIGCNVALFQPMHRGTKCRPASIPPENMEKISMFWISVPAHSVAHTTEIAPPPTDRRVSLDRSRTNPSFLTPDQQATMPGEENKEFDDELVDYEEEEETTTDASKAAAEGKDAKK
ncbi:Spliceosome RNA helicase ddx39b [Phytophthora pseudosyringae]|uniref:Spliceosome RNA helicase ddx39b n=1 Tax=Phytophthora pseudosyringae TaxID=221518 RepID=A0A8T1W0T6_9STRA|nr:Spliceosome RNA helicase ddx39b [Phytophthora pseudosyringae]